METGKPSPVEHKKQPHVNLSSHFLGFKEHLLLTFRVLKDNWKRLLAIQFLRFFVSFLFSVFFLVFISFIFIGGLGSLKTGTLDPKIFKTLILTSTPMLLLAIITVGIIQGWFQAAFIVCLRDREENPSLQMVFGRSKKYVIPLFLLSLLYAFVVLGGFFLFLVPGILFAFWFMFFSYAAIYEDRRGLGALSWSKFLIQGNSGKSLVRLILGLAIALGLQFFWRILDKSIDSFLLQTELPRILSVTSSLIILGFNICLYLAGQIFVVVLYENLRAVDREAMFAPSRRFQTVLILTALAGFLVIPGVFIVAPKLVSRFSKVAPLPTPLRLPIHKEIDEAQKRARDASRKQTMKAVQMSLELYHARTGKYPDINGFCSMADILIKAGDLSGPPNDLGGREECGPSGDWFPQGEFETPVYKYEVVSNGADYKLILLQESGETTILTAPKTTY